MLNNHREGKKGVTEEMKDVQKDMREVSCSGDVGFSSLPIQTVKKRLQEGFVFNLLLIGETGIGKSTLISSLFNIPHDITGESHFKSEVTLKSRTYNLTEKGVNLRLTVVETIGYGQQINRSDNFKPIADYIELQHERYFQEDSSLMRSMELYADTRIHACLYFIPPTGHNLKSIDLFCMRQLHDKVNIIPLVARSDSLSKEELRRFKTAINAVLAQEKIDVYRFPTDDEEMADTNRQSNDQVPFAVAASGDRMQIGDVQTRARMYPWGTVLIEDREHSDFLLLKEALIGVNLEDLRERTHAEFYEKYRTARMIQLGFPEFVGGDGLNLQEFYQKKRDSMHQEMLEKEEQLKKRFAEKVKKRDEEFKALEDAMHAKYHKLAEAHKLEEQKIRNSKLLLEREIAAFKKRANNKKR